MALPLPEVLFQHVISCLLPRDSIVRLGIHDLVHLLHRQASQLLLHLAAELRGVLRMVELFDQIGNQVLLRQERIRNPFRGRLIPLDASVEPPCISKCPRQYFALDTGYKVFRFEGVGARAPERDSRQREALALQLHGKSKTSFFAARAIAGAAI